LKYVIDNRLSEENSEFVCSKCGFPAYNSTVFKSKESPYSETLTCPECKNDDIISRRLSKFRKGWRFILESGLNDEVDAIPGAYLQLAEKSDKKIELGNMQMKDVPPDIAMQLQTKMKELQEIVKKSGILDDLEKEGVVLNLNVTA